MSSLTPPKTSDSLVVTVSFRAYGNVKVTDHVSLGELQCKNGADTILFDWRTVRAVEAARVFFAQPILITSAYRTEAYNRAIGGASGSYHVSGRAIDGYLPGIAPSLLAKFLQNWGMKGVGCYEDDGFVHVDSRTTAFYWKNQSVTPVSTHLPTLRLGSSGQDVRDLQWLLGRHGQSLTVDGQFGPKTQTALTAFQKAQNLTVDGIAGKQSWGALLKS